MGSHRRCWGQCLCNQGCLLCFSRQATLLSDPRLRTCKHKRMRSCARTQPARTDRPPWRPTSASASSLWGRRGHRLLQLSIRTATTRGTLSAATLLCRSQAAVAGAGNYLAQNTEESQRIGHKHHDQRIVFAAISGWTLAFWQSYEDFEAARHHGPKGPAPIHWWDLRQVQDLTVDFEDINAVECPHRLRLLMLKGNLYFRVEAPEDVPVWVAAIRKVVEEAGWVYVKERDTPLHQQKRWPAAVGLARAVSSGAPIGERALAIAYHLYDIDFNTELRLGEIMLLILELHAAILTCEERAEGGDRLTAVVSAESRFHRGELFLRALHFRRRCCPAQAVAIKKDGFINNGHAAILEAFDLLPDGNPGHHPGDGGEACAVM
eukprot:TRINITY_DN10434_c0_g1_i2.p1 TRINITY_DN10434_c0_g1~~TRINITY_DN10434_c0_g1_i2.p1  ORF type:complete len:378 (-),score=61.69 TRINITY_DN10434_c0_g1_i2:116-1249(-)